MKRSEFESYHPLVNFIYFAAAIGFSMVCMNPVFLFISLFCALLYGTLLGNKNKTKKNLSYMLFLVLFMAVLNPLFNHRGATILTYLPDGNPLTLESIVYGIASAVMVVATICWFSCFSYVFTSDKLMHIFGRILPSFSLIFSMTLRFVPRFIQQVKQINLANKTMGKVSQNSSLKNKIKNGISVISAVLTWSFENSVDTSNSMRARGFGVAERTSFSLFRFCLRDLLFMLTVLSLCAYIIIAMIFEKIEFNYFPYISGAGLTPYSVSVYIAFLFLCLMPVLIELWEVKKWKSLRRKI